MREYKQIRESFANERRGRAMGSSRRSQPSRTPAVPQAAVPAPAVPIPGNTAGSADAASAGGRRSNTAMPSTPPKHRIQASPIAPVPIARPAPATAAHAASGPGDEGSRVIVTVEYGKRSARLNLPSSLPVAELLPDIAKKLGVLDPTLVYGGYRLLREDETPIGSPSSLAEQSVRDGDQLRLQVNALDDQDRVYDDVVEAVADSVSRTHRPWTNENTTLTSLVVSCALLGVGALCVALAPASVVNAVICGLVAVSLLAIGAVLSARRLDREALSLSLAACLFAGVCGYHLMGALLRGPFYGFPAIGIGTGLVLSGGCCALSLARGRLHAVIPVIIGAVLLLLGVVGVVVPQWSARSWVIAISLIGLAANALPWLSLSVARLSVDSPTSESEIFALPKAIDIHEVRKQYQTGSTLLFDLRAAAGALIVFGVPITVSSPNSAGIALTLVLFASMLLDARRIYSQSEMMVTVIFAGLGVCLSCAACTAYHPSWVTVIIGVFSIGALLCVIDTQLIHRSSIAMTRLADTANVIGVMATLPLAYLALGL